MILDTGDRTPYASGAVRDMKEGKGRMDLLPLDVLLDIYCDEASYTTRNVILDIVSFLKSGDRKYLHFAIKDSMIYPNPWTTWLELAKHFEEGAKKYGERNWEKGIPVQSYIDSALRHYIKYIRGDKDEPHDRAFLWNLVCAIWTCKYKDELNEYGE
jgi:hypothetical protein